jgi:hypothetical protein
MPGAKLIKGVARRVLRQELARQKRALADAQAELAAARVIGRPRRSMIENAQRGGSSYPISLLPGCRLRSARVTDQTKRLPNQNGNTQAGHFSLI